MMAKEQERLLSVKKLIDNTHMHLEIWEDSEKNLFISATSVSPAGTVYFNTTASLLCMFLESRINLQTLFDKGPSFIVDIISDTKTTSYSTRDAEIELGCGDQTIGELLGNLPLEIWKC
jgi:hypothetical protein